MEIFELRERLAEIADEWPPGCWLFAADSQLYLMRVNIDGERAMTRSGGVDPDYIVAAYDIPCDGGDW